MQMEHVSDRMESYVLTGKHDYFLRALELIGAICDLATVLRLDEEWNEVFAML
jgi:hypothetical protein